MRVRDGFEHAERDSLSYRAPLPKAIHNSEVMNAQLNLSPSSNHFNRLTDRLNCAFLQCKIEGL